MSFIIFFNSKFLLLLLKICYTYKTIKFVNIEKFNLQKKEVIKINTHIVKPLSSKKENLFLILTFFILLLIAGISLKLTHKDEFKIDLKEGEIISFDTLNSIELGLYSDIKNSLTDMSQLKEESGELPTLKTLIEEEIPPYYKDLTWEQRGAVEWKELKHDGETFLLGVGSNKVGIFIIKLNENPENSDVFYLHEEVSLEKLETNFEKYESLAKKVIPYTGGDERQKFVGKE